MNEFSVVRRHGSLTPQVVTPRSGQIERRGSVLTHEEARAAHFTWLLFLIVLLGWVSPVLGAELSPESDLSELTLVRSGGDKAVVKFGAGPLIMISVGDRIGRNGAEVKEIAAGRVVLEEVFTGKDGRPNRAQIILKEGERGGTRYLLRPDETPPPGTRPVIIFPQGDEKRR